MKGAKSQAGTYLTIGLGLIGFSFLPHVWNPPSLRTLGGAFLLVAIMFALSIWFRWRWLVKMVNYVSSIAVNHLALFLTLIGFALVLIEASYVFLGVIVIYAAYTMLALVIERQLGRDVLRPLFDKLNIFQPSVKIPKDV